MTPPRTALAAAALVLLAGPALAACGSHDSLQRLASGAGPHGAPALAPSTPDDGSSSDDGGGEPPSDDGFGSESASPDGSGDSAACSTLLSDITDVETDLGGATSPADLSAKVSALEATLTADAAGGSDELKKAVASYDALLSKIVTDATKRDTAAIQKDESQLVTVSEALESACS